MTVQELKQAIEAAGWVVSVDSDWKIEAHTADQPFWNDELPGKALAATPEYQTGFAKFSADMEALGMDMSARRGASKRF